MKKIFLTVGLLLLVVLAAAVYYAGGATPIIKERVVDVPLS
jgi:hypothetical protein